MKRSISLAPRAAALLAAASLLLATPAQAFAPPRKSKSPPATTETTAPPAAATPAAPATPGEPTAGELSDQAIERFKAKDYDAAARLFEQAHGLDPNPNYLFNIGRVYEEKRDLKLAIEYYERFVKEPGATIESRDLALQRMRVLKAILKETEPDANEAAKPAPEPAKPEPEVAKPVVTDPDPKKKLRLAGYGLLGVGGVSMIVGGIFGGLALGKRNDLDDTNIVDERQSLARDGKTFALVSDISLFAGAGIALTGLVLVLVARKPKAASRSAWTPSVGRGHAGLAWTLRF